MTTETAPVASFPAEFIVYMPTGPLHCCEKHARQARSIMQVLGGYAAIADAEDGQQCTNCLNEAGKEKG